jgi:hypothetical protein
MIVEVKTPSEELEADRDYRSFLSIEVNGSESFSVFDGEPEDANLSRDFNACHSIVGLMELAYEAGKRGEEFITKETEVQRGEDY